MFIVFSGGQHGRSDQIVLGIVHGNNNVVVSRLSSVQAESDISDYLGVRQLLDVNRLAQNPVD